MSWFLWMAAAMQTASAAPDLAQLHVFATVEQRPTFKGASRIRLGTFEGPILWPGQKVTYWFLMDRHDEEGRLVAQSVADSATCPASLAVVSNLQKLKLPHPDVPGVRPDFDAVSLDGTLYRLDVTARHPAGNVGDLSITSHGGTPLAEWTKALNGALDACWSPREPAKT